MSDRLTSAIAEIAHKIKAGEYRSEAEISLGIIQRVLHELSWPVFDNQVVAPEFRIENRKVDYALCQSPGKALILIEVKDLGKADSKGEKQLFQYAFNHGVPVAILTDGQKWRFFLPAGVGTFEDRCFATIDLLKEDSSKCAQELALNLDKGAVFSGLARDYAHRTYNARQKQRDAEAKYSTSWSKLVTGPDSLLLEIFSEEVERQSGVKPNRESAAEFIRRQSTSGDRPFIPISRQTTRESTTGGRTSGTSKEFSYTYGGETKHYNTGADLIAGVFNLLANREPDFLHRYRAQYPGKTNPLIAPSRDQLYPRRPESRRTARKIHGGWWIGTYSSSGEKLKLIRQACELAGIEFGSDLVVVMSAGPSRKRRS